ncbi:MAG TPA: MFS transporter [Candidatus Marinimicrobia bacterium]|nr:MFS transporter [Candidatus Neomarinimicrobiota bacterium]
MKLVEKYAFRNTALNTIAEGFWGFGVSFHTVYAIIPLFIKTLGAPDWIIGMLPGSLIIFVALPQLFSTFYVRRISNIIRTNMLAHYGLAIPVGLLFFVYGILGIDGVLGWRIYLVIFTIYGLSIGLIMPFWILFLERISIEKKRGRFLGITFSLNGLMGLLGGVAAAFILDNQQIAFPKNFGILFGLFLLSILIGTSFFGGIRTDEALNRFSAPKQSFREFRLQAKTMLQQISYRNYLISRIFFSSQFLIHGFFAIYGHEKLGFDVKEAGIFTAITLVMASAANYFAGVLGDRYGYKYIIAVIYGSLALAAFSILGISQLWHLYLIFALIGLAQGITATGHMNMLIQFSQGNDTRLYYALVDTIQSAALLIIMALGTIVTTLLGYEYLFYAAGSALLMAFYIILRKV